MKAYERCSLRTTQAEWSVCGVVIGKEVAVVQWKVGGKVVTEDVPVRAIVSIQPME